MIVCGCPRMHEEHEFRAKDGAWGLCATCSHALGAHRSQGMADSVIEFVRRLDIKGFDVQVDGDRVLLELHTGTPS